MLQPVRFACLTSCLAAAAAVLLAGNDAVAWGPVAHLDIGLRLVEGAVALLPAVRALIERHPDDFLYGCLAADTIVGKDRSRRHEHCHDWNVARSLLGVARERGAAAESFMLGYICHLGADVVAHNHIVPQLIITHYRAKGVGHLYWEARADGKLLDEFPELRGIWRDFGRIRLPHHDRLLAENLVPTLFTNRISAGMFHQSLALQRYGPWLHAIERIERRSRLVFTREQLVHWRTLALEGARRAVNHPQSHRLDGLDPTGREALDHARARRKLLRKLLRSDRLLSSELDAARAEALGEIRRVDIGHFEDDPPGT
jgi:hypothetical protein